jgi:hypothetical protein
VHSSGEWMEATYTMHPVKQSPQDLGSAITYQRRYAVGAVLSLNIDDDDDANSASGRSQQSAGQNNGQQKDDKPWLNKNTKEFNGAVAKLQKGETTLAKIEAFYKLNKEVKAELLSHVPQSVN